MWRAVRGSAGCCIFALLSLGLPAALSVADPSGEDHPFFVAGLLRRGDHDPSPLATGPVARQGLIGFVGSRILLMIESSYRRMRMVPDSRR